MKDALQIFCGDEGFLTEQAGLKHLKTHLQRHQEDVDQEVLNATVENGGAFKTFLDRFYMSARSLPLFGSKKCLYVKGMNVIADSPTGRAVSTKDLLAEWTTFLQDTLQRTGDGLHIILTLYPVDRRRKEYRWLKTHGTFTDTGKGLVDEAMVKKTAQQFHISITQSAVQALANRTAGSVRLLHMELGKLATYLEPNGTLEEDVVLRMVPSFGTGNFFESTEAFFSFDLSWGLEALRRQFFTDLQAGRPILVSLQNRTRLIIQLRTLLDTRQLQKNFQKEAFEALSHKHENTFGKKEKKSSFNIFTQNLWYITHKVAPTAYQRPLAYWIDCQIAYGRAFETILRHPDKQRETLEQVFISCLGATLKHISPSSPPKFPQLKHQAP